MTKPTKRHHFGSGALALRPEISVFVNCPYDDSFRPIFDAIVFSTVCCGFLPRCALESGSNSIARIDKIVSAIHSSRYSIHDLSRCQGEGDANLARFTMPLELGIAMAQRFGKRKTSLHHDWLALVPKGHLYKKYISDLAGYDATEYDGTVETAVPNVMSWLATRPSAVESPTPHAVLESLPFFQQAVGNLCDEWHGCQPWPDLVMTAIRVGRDRGLIPADS